VSAVPGPEDVSRELTFASAPPLWVVVLVIVPIAVLYVAAIYRREGASASRNAKVALGALRFAVVALLLLVLFQPVSESKVYAVSRSTVGVLVDESLSMDRAEEYESGLAASLAKAAGIPENEVNSTSRTELVRKVLKRQDVDLLADLQKRVDVRLYGFATSPRSISSIDETLSQPNEPSRGGTAIGDALLAALSELRHRQLAGLVVVTDGQSNLGKDPQEVAAAAQASDAVPIHTVAVGNPSEPRNVAVLAVDAPDAAMVEETIPVAVSLDARGFPNEPGEIVVTNKPTGESLAKHDFTLGPHGGQQTETLFFKPMHEGDYLLEVKFVPKPGEQFTDDNVRTVPLRVQPEVIKVLYVEGRPRWQYRYLKDVLLRAPNVKAQCLLTSAAVDFIQESTKDVPALTRLPPTRKDLFQYDVIILGDVAPDDVDALHSRASTEELLNEIKEFVTLGGGFVMIAGQLHSPRDYRDTPIADLLPVEIGDPDEERSNVHDKGQFRPHLPDWELPHRIVTLETDVAKNKKLLEDAEYGLPAMWWYQPVRRAKPGAETILVHPTNRNQFGPHVLMAATRVPAGRTLYVGFDETWRWRMPYADRYTERFWRAAIRDVAIQKLRSSDKRFDLRTDKERYNLGDPVELQVRVFDDDFRPAHADHQIVHFQRADRPAEEVTVAKQDEGTYAKTLRADLPGSWRLWLEDPSQAGKRLSQRTIEVQVPMLEFVNPSLDKARLEAIASASGGKCVRLDELPALLAGLSGSANRVPIRTERRDLWDRAEVLVVVVMLLSIEWILRKKYNLL
jgi:hypothetical protein